MVKSPVNVMMKNIVEYIWAWVSDILSFRVSYEDDYYREYKAIVYGKKWMVSYCMEEGEISFVGVQDDDYDYDNDPDGIMALSEEDEDEDKTLYMRSDIIPDILRKAIEEDFRKRGELKEV